MPSAKPIVKLRYDTQLREAIKEAYPNMSDSQLIFFASYIENGMNGTAAYKALHPKVSRNVAAVQARRILSEIPFASILDIMGLGVESIRDALVDLQRDDPKSYLKYQMKLRGLDKTQVELSGEVAMPIINIVTDVQK